MPNKKSGQQKKQQAKRERRSARRKEHAKKIATQERDKGALERSLEMKRQRRAEFPDFRYQEKHGNPEFVAIVKDAISRFDFAELGKTEQIAFSMMKEFGAEHALAAIQKNMRKLQEEGKNDAYIASADLQWLFSVGHAVFSHIPDDVKRRFLPMNDVEFQYPPGKVIVAKFRSLLAQKSSGGTIYYSRYEPTIDFEGKEYVVGFSTEALKRTCERTMKDPLRYASLGDVYAYFEDCQYFEPCTLRGGNDAFSFFDECPPHHSPQLASSQRLLSEKILGTKEVDPAKGKLYYRVGYCPVALDKGFAKAKTLLFPGFKQTPEYEALDNADMPPDMKRRLQHLATNSDMSSLWEEGDISALKWFHDNGVPQVIQTAKPLFRTSLSGATRRGSNVVLCVILSKLGGEIRSPLRVRFISNALTLVLWH